MTGEERIKEDLCKAQEEKTSLSCASNAGVDIDWERYDYFIGFVDGCERALFHLKETANE